MLNAYQPTGQTSAKMGIAPSEEVELSPWGLSPSLGHHFCFCAGFRMTAHRDGAACTGAVVRKPPRNEPAGEVRGGRSGLSYGDLGDAEGVCEDCNGLEGEQWRVWWEAEAGVDG